MAEDVQVIPVHKREFENACMKLTAVMHVVMGHVHNEDSPHRLFSQGILEILTGKTTVVHADEHNAAAAAAKAQSAAEDADALNEPIIVTADQVAAANT